ncbi:hypothetical protein D3C75_903250 [compost metagenome]
MLPSRSARTGTADVAVRPCAASKRSMRTACWPSKVTRATPPCGLSVAHRAPSAVNCRREATSPGSRRASRSSAGKRPCALASGDVPRTRSASQISPRGLSTSEAICETAMPVASKRAAPGGRRHICRSASTQNVPWRSCSTHCTRLCGRPKEAGGSCQRRPSNQRRPPLTAAHRRPLRSCAKRGTTPTGTPCGRPKLRRRSCVNWLMPAWK